MIIFAILKLLVTSSTESKVKNEDIRVQSAAYCH